MRWRAYVWPALALALALAAPPRPVAAEASAWGPGLSDREMAIQRWFSHLTFQGDRTAHPWPEWHDNGKQFDVTSLRYQLAFCGYGCAALAARTPAYTDLARMQFDDLCQRMVDTRVWRYVTHYWRYGDGPPDPCRFENVMYTGHLAQLMCLYELMTGDLKYSTEGWEFVWTDGRKIRYTLERAIRAMHEQSVEGPDGGICCEPGMLFADCNSHSALSFQLYDLVHGTRYAEANARWFDWMSRHFRTKLPNSREFLYVAYQRDRRYFLPVGDTGADGWALAWGMPWFPRPEFATEGWQALLRRARWQRPAKGSLFAEGNPLVRCCGKSTPAAGNSFLLLLARQVEGAESRHAREILNWLESTIGRSVDLDGDGQKECAFYDDGPAYRIPVTGNVAAALATDGLSLRQLYRTSRKPLLEAPCLARVEYPAVVVRSAEYRRPILRFQILPGTAAPLETTGVVCERIVGPVTVTRDGMPFRDFAREGTRLTLRTRLAREHLFEVRLEQP